MTLNKLAFSLVGSLALATTGFAGTAPVKSGKVCTACTAPAAEEELGLTLGVGYDSSFVFRGLNLADNWISTNLDYTLPLTSTVKLNLGAVYGTTAGDGFLQDLRDDLGLGAFDLSYQRLELAAGISADLGGVELGVGYRWYHHMGDGNAFLDDGHEVGVTLATKAGPINIGVGGYYDFAAEGWYFEAGINSEIKLCDRVSLVPGASIGYASSYNYQASDTVVALANFFGADTTVDGFTAVNLSLALPIKLSKHATLTPFVAWALPIDDLDDKGADDQLHGGVNLSVKF